MCNLQGTGLFITKYQQQKYEMYEKATADNLIKQYSVYLEKFRNHDSIKILDIGGASGFFGMSLYNYFSGKKCEIIVLDYVKYDTWDEYKEKIVFVENSAENMLELFKKNTFDIIFANRVFHHFIKENWKTTLSGINNIMHQIPIILKEEGLFCITDYFYDGRVFDSSASRIIYRLTSCKKSLFISLFRKIESKSAGVGVFFLSRKMWYKLFKENNLFVQSLYEGHKLKRKWYKLVIYKILLLIKNCQEDVIFVLQK
jgi:hypothetical protein